MTISELCRAAPDARALRLGVLEEFRRRVGFDGFVWLLTDPVTEVGAAPVADVGDAFAELPHLIELKYSTSVNRWTALADPVAGLQASTVGRPDDSLIWREVLHRHGVQDVASMVFRDRFGCWAFLDLWRRDGATFTDAELGWLRTHVVDVTAGLRRCVADTFRAAPRNRTSRRSGPIVLVLTSDLVVRDQTPDTDRFLRALLPPDGERAPVPAGAYNVAAQLLANERGVDLHPPTARVDVGGDWLVLRAARIGHDIAVSMEPITPTDRCDLLARSCGLTRRETELLERIAAGGDTRSLAQQMSLSEHTVQDHLKAMFAKTGASSRRDLLVRALGR